MTSEDILHLYSTFRDDEGIGGTEAALLCVAISLTQVAYQIMYLGNGNASTQMGAIEHLAKEISDGLSQLASVIEAKE